MIGSLSDYAKRIGKTPAYVTKLRQSNRLVLVGDDARPQVDFEASDRLVAATAQLGSAGNGANAGGGQGAEVAAPAPDRFGAVYRQSQAQHKAYTARLSELEWRKRSGLVIDKTTIERAVFEAFRELRDAAFASVKTQARTVLGMTELQQVENALEDELRSVFAGWEERMRSRVEASVS